MDDTSKPAMYTGMQYQLNLPLNNAPRIQAPLRGILRKPGSANTEAQGKRFYCKFCDIGFDNEVAFAQHSSSVLHYFKIASNALQPYTGNAAAKPLSALGPYAARNLRPPGFQPNALGPNPFRLRRPLLPAPGGPRYPLQGIRPYHPRQAINTPVSGYLPLGPNPNPSQLQNQCRPQVSGFLPLQSNSMAPAKNEQATQGLPKDSLRDGALQIKPNFLQDSSFSTPQAGVSKGLFQRSSPRNETPWSLLGTKQNFYRERSHETSSDHLQEARRHTFQSKPEHLRGPLIIDEKQQANSLAHNKHSHTTQLSEKESLRFSSNNEQHPSTSKNQEAGHLAVNKILQLAALKTTGSKENSGQERQFSTMQTTVRHPVSGWNMASKTQPPVYVRGSTGGHQDSGGLISPDTMDHGPVFTSDISANWPKPDIPENDCHQQEDQDEGSDQSDHYRKSQPHREGPEIGDMKYGGHRTQRKPGKETIPGFNFVFPDDYDDSSSDESEKNKPVEPSAWSKSTDRQKPVSSSKRSAKTILVDDYGFTDLEDDSSISDVSFDEIYLPDPTKPSSREETLKDGSKKYDPFEGVDLTHHHHLWQSQDQKVHHKSKRSAESQGPSKRALSEGELETDSEPEDFPPRKVIKPDKRDQPLKIQINLMRDQQTRKAKQNVQRSRRKDTLHSEEGDTYATDKHSYKKHQQIQKATPDMEYRSRYKDHSSGRSMRGHQYEEGYRQERDGSDDGMKTNKPSGSKHRHQKDHHNSRKARRHEHSASQNDYYDDRYKAHPTSPGHRSSPNRSPGPHMRRSPDSKRLNRRSHSPDRRSPHRRSPRHSPDRRSPHRRSSHHSPDRRSPHRRSSHHSPDRRSPHRRSPHHSPDRRSPHRRSPRHSPDRRSPHRRSPRHSPDRRSPHRRSPQSKRSPSPGKRWSPGRRRTPDRRRSRSPHRRSPDSWSPDRRGGPYRSPDRRSSPDRGRSQNQRSPDRRKHSHTRRSLSPDGRRSPEYDKKKSNAKRSSSLDRNRDYDQHQRKSYDPDQRKLGPDNRSNAQQQQHSVRPTLTQSGLPQGSAGLFGPRFPLQPGVPAPNVSRFSLTNQVPAKGTASMGHSSVQSLQPQQGNLGLPGSRYSLPQPVQGPSAPANRQTPPSTSIPGTFGAPQQRPAMVATAYGPLFPPRPNTPQMMLPPPAVTYPTSVRLEPPRGQPSGPPAFLSVPPPGMLPASRSAAVVPPPGMLPASRPTAVVPPPGILPASRQGIAVPPPGMFPASTPAGIVPSPGMLPASRPASLSVNVQPQTLAAAAPGNAMSRLGGGNIGVSPMSAPQSAQPARPQMISYPPPSAARWRAQRPPSSTPQQNIAAPVSVSTSCPPTMVSKQPPWQVANAGAQSNLTAYPTTQHQLLGAPILSQTQSIPLQPRVNSVVMPLNLQGRAAEVPNVSIGTVGQLPQSSSGAAVTGVAQAQLAVQRPPYGLPCPGPAASTPATTVVSSQILTSAPWVKQVQGSNSEKLSESQIQNNVTKKVSESEAIDEELRRRVAKQIELLRVEADKDEERKRQQKKEEASKEAEKKKPPEEQASEEAKEKRRSNRDEASVEAERKKQSKEAKEAAKEIRRAMYFDNPKQFIIAKKQGYLQQKEEQWKKVMKSRATSEGKLELFQTNPLQYVMSYKEAAEQKKRNKQGIQGKNQTREEFEEFLNQKDEKTARKIAEKQARREEYLANPRKYIAEVRKRRMAKKLEKQAAGEGKSTVSQSDGETSVETSNKVEGPQSTSLLSDSAQVFGDVDYRCHPVSAATTVNEPVSKATKFGLLDTDERQRLPKPQDRNIEQHTGHQVVNISTDKSSEFDTGIKAHNIPGRRVLLDTDERQRLVPRNTTPEGRDTSKTMSGPNTNKPNIHDGQKQVKKQSVSANESGQSNLQINANETLKSSSNKNGSSQNLTKKDGETSKLQKNENGMCGTLEKDEDLRDHSKKDEDLRDQDVDLREQTKKDQDLRDPSKNDVDLRHQSKKNEHSKNPSEKDEDMREQSKNDVDLRDRSKKDVGSRDQSEKGENRRDQANKGEDSTKDQDVRDQLKKDKGMRDLTKEDGDLGGPSNKDEDMRNQSNKNHGMMEQGKGDEDLRVESQKDRDMRSLSNKDQDMRSRSNKDQDMRSRSNKDQDMRSRSNKDHYMRTQSSKYHDKGEQSKKTNSGSQSRNLRNQPQKDEVLRSTGQNSASAENRGYKAGDLGWKVRGGSARRSKYDAQDNEKLRSGESYDKNIKDSVQKQESRSGRSNDVDMRYEIQRRQHHDRLPGSSVERRPTDCFDEQSQQKSSWRHGRDQHPPDARGYDRRSRSGSRHVSREPSYPKDRSEEFRHDLRGRGHMRDSTPTNVESKYTRDAHDNRRHRDSDDRAQERHSFGRRDGHDRDRRRERFDEPARSGRRSGSLPHRGASRDRRAPQDEGAPEYIADSEDHLAYRAQMAMEDWQREEILQILPSQYTPTQVEEFYWVLVDNVKILIEEFQRTEHYTVDELLEAMNEEDRENVAQMQAVTGMENLASAARVIYVLRLMDQDVVQVLGGLGPQLLQSMVVSDPRLRDTAGISIQSIIASLGLGTQVEAPPLEDIDTLEVSFEEDDGHDDRRVSMYEDPEVDCMVVNDGPVREQEVYRDDDILYEDHFQDGPLIDDDVDMVDLDRYPSNRYESEHLSRDSGSRDWSPGRAGYGDDGYHRRSASHHRDHRESRDQEHQRRDYRDRREPDWRGSDRGYPRSEEFSENQHRHEEYKDTMRGPDDREYRRHERYEDTGHMGASPPRDRGTGYHHGYRSHTSFHQGR